MRAGPALLTAAAVLPFMACASAPPARPLSSTPLPRPAEQACARRPLAFEPVVTGRYVLTVKETDWNPVGEAACCSRSAAANDPARDGRPPYRSTLAFSREGDGWSLEEREFTGPFAPVLVGELGDASLQWRRIVRIAPE